MPKQTGIQAKGLPWLGKGRDFRVAIIGDLILDEYLDGSVLRISPEAPVPVHHVKTQSSRAGGAANNALNIKRLGAEPILLGVWGADEGAKHLASLLRENGIRTEHILTDAERPTTRKCRVYSENQQLLRIDWELVQELSELFQERLISSLKNIEFDALLLSDYAKGTLPEALVKKAISLAIERGIPSIVDPKGRDYQRYRGATVVTPNYKEACEANGLDPTQSYPGDQLGRKLIERCGINHVLVTMGAKGMTFVPREGASIAKAAQAREVFDVTGAGDTVASVFALAIAAGSEFEWAMELSNVAAGVVVQRKGVHPISLDELTEALADQTFRAERQGSKLQAGQKFPQSEAKIHSLNELTPLTRRAQDEGRRMVFTNGCFDILHAGHVSYLERARAEGDFLVIGVNSDASVRRLKGPSRPVNQQENRMKLLAALSFVDFVVMFEEDTPINLIESLKPNVLVKGADWKVEDIVGGGLLKSWGGEVKTIPLVPGLSTTNLIDKVKAR